MRWDAAAATDINHSDIDIDINIDSDSDIDSDSSRPRHRPLRGDVALCVLFCLLGGLLFYTGLSSVRTWARTLAWESATATITRKRLVRHERWAGSAVSAGTEGVYYVYYVYTCSINYTYSAGGVAYTGYRVALLREYGDKAMCDAININSNSTSGVCHYDPDAPATSVYTLYYSPLLATLCLAGSWLLANLALYGVGTGGFLHDDTIINININHLIPAAFAAVYAAVCSGVLMWFSIRLLMAQGPYLEAYLALCVAVSLAIFALFSPCYHCHHHNHYGCRAAPTYAVVDARPSPG